MRRIATILTAATILLGDSLSAEENIGTLTLDSLSYVSFQDEETLSLAAGTIRFHFGRPLSTGAIPFTIEPEDVSIPAIAVRGGGTLSYSLASPASGVIKTTESGRQIAFTAAIDATFREEDHEGTLRHSIPFTTESASATSSNGRDRVEATGMRVPDGTSYVRLVGASTNDADAVPKPGTAVYTVLSGTFDRLP